MIYLQHYNKITYICVCVWEREREKAQEKSNNYLVYELTQNHTNMFTHARARTYKYVCVFHTVTKA